MPCETADRSEVLPQIAAAILSGEQSGRIRTIQADSGNASVQRAVPAILGNQSKRWVFSWGWLGVGGYFCFFWLMTLSFLEFRRVNSYEKMRFLKFETFGNTNSSRKLELEIS